MINEADCPIGLQEADAILLDKGDLIGMVSSKLNECDEVNVFRTPFFDSDLFQWPEALLDLERFAWQKSQ